MIFVSYIRPVLLHFLLQFVTFGGSPRKGSNHSKESLDILELTGVLRRELRLEMRCLKKLLYLVATST